MPVTVMIRIDQPTQQLNEQIQEFVIPDASAGPPGNDGVMTAAQAAALSQAIAQGAVVLYLSSSGSDANDGLSPQSPFLTPEKVWDFAASHGGSFVCFATGHFTMAQQDYFTPNPYGSKAVSLVFVCTPTDVFGTLTCSANNAARLVWTVGANPGIRQSVAASIIGGAPAGMVRIQVPGYNVVAADVGTGVQVSGSANRGNNHWGQIFAVDTVAQTMDVIMNNGVAPDAGPLTVTQSFRNKMLWCLTGANAGERKLIVASDLTTFTINRKMPNPIAIGDTFAIMNQDGTTFDYPNQLTLFGSAIAFMFCKFRLTGNNGLPFAITSDQCLMFGVEVDVTGPDAFFGGFNITNNANLFAGQTGAPQLRNWQNDTLGLFPPTLQGCGVAVHGGFFDETGGTAPLASVTARINGFCVLSSTGVGASDQSSVNLNEVDCDTVSALATACAELNTTAPNNHQTPWNGQYVDDPDYGCVTYDQNSTGELTNNVFQNSGGRAVAALGGSVVKTDRLPAGTGNVGTGLRCDYKSEIITDTGGAGHTAVTGTAGNAEIGHTSIPGPTILTYATINTPDGAGVQGVSDAYGNRIAPLQ